MRLKYATMLIALQAGEREKLIVGRLVVVSLVGLGVVWLPFIDSK
jgi:hypothetical protein